MLTFSEAKLEWGAAANPKPNTRASIREGPETDNRATIRRVIRFSVAECELRNLIGVGPTNVPPAAESVSTVKKKTGAPPCQTSPAEKEEKVQTQTRPEKVSTCQMSTAGKERDLNALALSTRYGGDFEEGKRAAACQIYLAAKVGKLAADTYYDDIRGGADEESQSSDHQTSSAPKKEEIKLIPGVTEDPFNSHRTSEESKGLPTRTSPDLNANANPRRPRSHPSVGVQQYVPDLLT